MSEQPISLKQLIEAMEEETVITNPSMYGEEPEDDKKDDGDDDSTKKKDEPIEPTEPDDSTEPDDKSDDEPIEPGQPVEPTEPIEPSDSMDLNKIFKLLSDTGYIKPPEDFKFEGTADSLEEALNLTNKSRYKEAADVLAASLDPELKDYIKYKASGGGGTITDYLKASLSNPIDLENIDLGNAKNQRIIVEANLRLTTPLSDDKIIKIVDKLEAAGELEVESNEALKSLKEYEKDQRDSYLEEGEKARDNYNSENSRAIDSSSMIPDTRKPKIKNFTTNIVGRKDGNTTDFNRMLSSIFSNPEHRVVLADIIYDSYDPNKGFNLERFKKQGKSKAVSDFHKKLEDTLSSKDIRGGSSSTITDPAKPLDWKELVSIMD